MSAGWQGGDVEIRGAIKADIGALNFGSIRRARAFDWNKKELELTPYLASCQLLHPRAEVAIICKVEGQ